MILNKKDIEAFFNDKSKIRLDVFDTIPSTNTYLKEKAEAGETEGLVAISAYQSAGKGRMGRAFSSPQESGIYMSILLRPQGSACDCVSVTACAAVAVSEAIETVTKIKTDVKWVNDLYLNGKKVCGILAEGALKGNGFDYVVLGIGVNVTNSFKGTELEEIASGLYDDLDHDTLTDIRNRLTAEIVNAFFKYYEYGIEKNHSEILSKYRQRLFIIGKEVDVISYGEIKKATVISLNSDFTLKVRYSDGTEGLLNSGEVRLKIQ